MPASFGFSNIWLQGDWVTRSILLLLLGMSLASWVVIVIKALDTWRHKENALNSEQFWHCTSLAEGLSVLSQRPNNLFHHLALTGQEAT